MAKLTTDEHMARTTTSSPEICSWLNRQRQSTEMHEVLRDDKSYPWEAFHSIRRSDSTSTNLVRNHGSHPYRNRNPVSTRLCAPAVHHVTNGCIYSARNEHPQPHLGLLDTTIAPREEDHELVTKHAGPPPDAVTDQGGEKYEAGGGGAEVVRLRSKYLGDGVEGDNTGRTTEGENETSLRRVSE